MSASIVIGAPAWDRAWSLPLWFESVRANVDPADTGLVFVVPASDASTRDAIAALSVGFDWVEVIRDRGTQLPREERPQERHASLAATRNQILQVVAGVRPEHYISWDTDLLIPAGGVEHIRSLGLPICTAWTWLNRQKPKKIRHFDGNEYIEVLWQDPMCASAMRWDRNTPGRALHYSADEFCIRAEGVWRTGVTLAFQVMDHRAYSAAHYGPHYDGEDVTFNWQLMRREVERWCCGDVRGVHLYDRTQRDEIALGWPNVMALSREVPLASDWSEERSIQHQAFGFFPTRGLRDGTASSRHSSVA